MSRYFVELEGRTFVVTLDGDVASVDGGSPVEARLDDAGGASVGRLTIGTTHEVISARRDGAPGRYVLRVGGRRYAVEALDERAHAIRDVGAASGRQGGPMALVAPMPGLVVRIHVVAGEQVDAGAPLVSIEAMKMENELRATASGTVRRVLVEAGVAVNKGEVLVEFA
ncbi:MAG: hypothetical protein IT356_11980 [Gemmatimonadaceae bacterium]|nr:hypothetical protein [Gemmatimonadaceae bacterium]